MKKCECGWTKDFVGEYREMNTSDDIDSPFSADGVNFDRGQEIRPPNKSVVRS